MHTGIVAAGRLQSLIDSRDYGREMLVMKVQLGQICDAVRSTVPQEMWGEIVEKLEERSSLQRRSMLRPRLSTMMTNPTTHRVHRRGRRILTSAAPTRHRWRLWTAAAADWAIRHANPTLKGALP